MEPPPLDGAALAGVAYASLLAFFAFVGFEDLANVVEEAKMPHRDIPIATLLTLVITTILYIAVVAIAVTAVPVGKLAGSPAPLSLVFESVAPLSPLIIGIIAIVATLNTILAQVSMAARVVYGMARQGDLPGFAGHVHPKTATPVFATALVIVATLVLALFVPFERLRINARHPARLRHGQPIAAAAARAQGRYRPTGMCGCPCGCRPPA